MIINYIEIENFGHIFSKSYMGLEYVGKIYISTVIILVSCYLLRNFVSDKITHLIKIIKYSISIAIALISLKYFDLNLKLGINLFHIYNILQLSNFLESISRKNEIVENKKTEENTVVNKYEMSDKNENECEHELIGDTSKRLEKITKKILNNKKNLKENEGILKEKEIIDEIEKKEKEEEEYMKLKNNLSSKKPKYTPKKNYNWIYVFSIQTFFVFFFYFFWSFIHNLTIVKIFLTLQLIKCLVSFDISYLKNNSNIKLLKRLTHIFDISYMLLISLFFTKIAYSPNNFNMMQKFSTIAIVFHAYYAYVYFVSYISLYHKQFRPSLFTFILFFHVFSIIGIIRLYYHSYGKSLLIQCIVFYLINGLGITFGAHRLWSHRAFKASSIVEIIFLILNSFANQGSVIVWSRNHRLHHKYSDTKYDPHNIRYGFFYSHVGWLLYKKTKYVKEKEKEIYIDDLLQNRLLLLQHKLDPFFNLFCCFIIPGIYSYFMYNNFWDGFFILGALRWIITLHATWSINSASHSFGHRPYNIDIKPSNNIFTSIVALGEGCHNYHHVFPYCYAMNENFYIISINPTKYIINFFYYLRLVWDLKSAQNICKEVRLRESLKLEKRNKLLSENIKNKIMKKDDTNYILDLMNSFKSIYNDYVSISTFKYILYFLRDIIIIITIFLIHLWYCYNKYGNGTMFYKFSEQISFEKNKICSAGLFFIFHILLYSIPMGTMFTSLYSLIYECKRELLFKKPFFNKFVGSIISSSILLPYSSEKTKKSLAISLHEDFLKVLKGPIYFDLYTIIFFLFILFYLTVSYVYGYFYFLIFFLIPYIVFNLWLLVYIYLLKTPSFLHIDINTKDVDLGVLNYIAFQSLLEWKKNNTVYQNKKRLHKLFFSFINFLHHHLCYTHIVEFINSKIPSYSTKEIYKHFDKTLDQYCALGNDKFMDALKEFL